MSIDEDSVKNCDKDTLIAGMIIGYAMGGENNNDSKMQSLIEEIARTFNANPLRVYLLVAQLIESEELNAAKDKIMHETEKGN